MKSKTTRRGPPVVVKRLVGCARCGKTHLHMEFVPLLRPVRVLTHWTSCPTTGEPILLAITANARNQGLAPQGENHE